MTALALGCLLAAATAKAETTATVAGAAAGPASSLGVVARYRRALELIGEKHARLYEIAGRHFALLSGRRLLVITGEYARHKGYNGVSDLGIVLTRRGRVSRIVFIDSPETPTYIKVIRMRLRALLGQRLRQKDRPMLAITGATITCEAVTRTVSETLDDLGALLHGVKIEDAAVRRNGLALAPVTAISL
ncbi:MAG: FMN-binding protein [Kiritimatiellaeota bacterium]|nr:FMN-binding protein [Kiritimatiellota bacterium]